MFRVFLILAFLVAWFLPVIIAAMYKLPHQGRIAVLSLLLGWTGAGWVAALIIVVGGAIRATRPPGDAQAQAPGPAQAQSPAYPGWREPAPAAGPAQVPERAQAPEWGQAQGRPPVQEQPPSPPSWPNDPR